MKNLTHYMSVRDFAESAAVSVQAVHKAIKAGRITKYQRVGYVYLVDRVEVLKLKKKKG